jgi:hypothetical protein
MSDNAGYPGSVERDPGYAIWPASGLLRYNYSS